MFDVRVGFHQQLDRTHVRRERVRDAFDHQGSVTGRWVIQYAPPGGVGPKRHDVPGTNRVISCHGKNRKTPSLNVSKVGFGSCR